MRIKGDIKQKKFMKAYEPVHESFVRYCKARSYRLISFDDLVNESITRAYENWDKIKEPEALKFYLFGIAKNIVSNLLRKKREKSLDELTVDYPDNSASADSNMDIEYLYLQLNKLSPNKKEALILFEISGFSIKEVAKIQDATEGSVKVLLSRARKELQKLMIDDPIIIKEREELR